MSRLIGLIAVRDLNMAPICAERHRWAASMSCKLERDNPTSIDETPAEAKEKKLPKKGTGSSWR